jgi:hypothetical protein
MSDSTISGMMPASLPLGDESVPCVQDGNNVQAPAAAFSIPVAGDSAPTALAQFQTWIDTSTAPPALKMYVGSAWVALYTVGGDGTLALAKPLGLSSDDRLTSALRFKSVIDCSASPNYPPADLGDFYVVSVAGKIGGASGVSVQAGDTLLCLANGTPSDTQANVGASWTIGQNNIVGAVTGPASSTVGGFAAFADATGKVVQDSGVILDTDTAMAANVDSRIPSQKAVKSYVGGQLSGALFYRGSISCSGSPNYPSGNTGDFYVVSVAGKIGGASGPNVEIADTLTCIAANAGGTQAAAGANWTIGQGNIDGAVTGPASSTSGHFTQFADATGKVVQDNGIILDTDPALTANVDSRIPSQKAVKSYVGGQLSGALFYRGSINCSGSPNYPSGNIGDFYVVSAAGKIGGASGPNVEIADTLTCIAANVGGTQASVGGSWTIGQGNIDGAVTGPASVTGGNFASFNGTTGKIIQDGSAALDTDPNMTANLDSRIPSQKAVKSYISANGTVPAGTVIYRGGLSCSASPNYPTANQGDFYVVSAAGKIGGASGLNVEIGDTLLCTTSSASGTQAGVGANWTIGQGNIDGAVTGPASATSNGFALFNGTTGKIIKDSLATFDTDATMAANSDNRIPSQKAVKSYVGNFVGPNLLVNSAFDVWQENTAYTLSSGSTKTHLADFWKGGCENSGTRTVSRVTGLQGSLYGLKMQRPSSSAAATASHLVQQFEQRESVYLAGKTVTVSFDFTIGANYSPATGPFVELFYGTGNEEDLVMNTSPPAFPSGGSSVSSPDLSAQVAAFGSTARISATLTLPSTASEVALGIRSGVYTGTAGADDSVTIDNVKLEIGSVATPYRRPDYRDELERCQWRYQKSFLQGTVPTTNAGVYTCQFIFRRILSGVTFEACWVPLRRNMRGVPAITLYNPENTNSQIHNDNTTADCSSSTTDYTTEFGFRVSCLGDSGGVPGNALCVHWVADKRL